VLRDGSATTPVIYGLVDSALTPEILKLVFSFLHERLGFSNRGSTLGVRTISMRAGLFTWPAGRPSPIAGPALCRYFENIAPPVGHETV
jgi:hypothetical protein